MKRILSVLTAALVTMIASMNVAASNDEEIVIKISAAGDCTLGSDLSYGYGGSFMEVYNTKKDYSYFFQNVKSVFEADDLTIVNLEGPLTTSTNKADKTYAFKGNPDFVNILSEGSIEAVNFANNHAYDYGAQGNTDTVNSLNNVGIAYSDKGNSPIVDVKGVKIGLVGLSAGADSSYYREQVKNNIESVKSKGADIVIVSFHWGVETKNYPEAYQQTLGRFTIDCGADLVLGHHPHVLQGIEEYKGKYIVYSLGNFCFGGNRNPSDKDTMIFTQEFALKNDEIVYTDAVVLPASVSSVSNRNDFQPTLVEGSEKERIFSRLSTYSLGLNNGVDIIEGLKCESARETISEPVLLPIIVNIDYNGQALSLDLPVYSKSDRTYYPMRELLETLGAEVSWDDATKTASGAIGDNIVEFTVDSSMYKVNGEEFEMADTTFIDSDRAYIPIRYAAEGLGLIVGWDEATGTIIISK